MVQRLLIFVLFLPVLVGCSEPDEPLQGWKESNVEIVEPGQSGAPARQVVAPGEAPLTTPMTATDFDTSTDLDMIDVENLAVTETGEETRSLADSLERGDPLDLDPLRRRQKTGTSTSRETTPTATRRPAPAPTTSEPATSTSTSRTPPMTDTTSTTTSERDQPEDPESAPPERRERPEPTDPDEETPPDEAARERPEPQDDEEPDTDSPPPIVDETPPSPENKEPEARGEENGE